MAQNSKKLKDDDIVSILKRSISNAESYNNSQLATEREEVLKYYRGELPKPLHSGNSKYVSTDVYDAVESAKAMLVETFSAGRDIIRFSPKGPDDVIPARIATAYTNYVLFQQNAGEQIIRTCIHDGLTSRNAIIRVYWDSVNTDIEEDFKDVDEAALGLLLSQGDTQLTKLELDEDTGLYSGTIVRTETQSQVRVENVPPNQFLVDPAIKGLYEAPELTYWTYKTRSELREDGYKDAQIDKLGPSVGDHLFDEEEQERYAAVGGVVWGRNTNDDGTPANQRFIVYETFKKLDVEGTGISTWWRFVWGGSVILEKEAVDGHPFYSYAPLPMPHCFYGDNFAKRAIPTQNAKTVLTRGIIDHTLITNNPRYGVVKGGLTNPRELLDNRVGGIVNMSRPDAVMPLPQASLNPYVFTTIQLLDTAKEDATGVSRLSQGLNKDAVSKQNSDAMVERLMSAGHTRTKIMAREFVHQLLKPLFLKIYQLVIENEDQQKIIEVAGEYIPVDPSRWKQRRDVDIDARLGYREDEREAQDLVSFHQLLASDPANRRIYSEQKRYQLLTRVLNIKGYKNPTEFLENPASLQPEQPDPMAQAEVAKVQAETSKIQVDTQIAQAAQQFKQALESARLQKESEEFQAEHALQIRDADRKDAETENRIVTAQAELAIAQSEAAQTPDENRKLSSIISPNS